MRTEPGGTGPWTKLLIFLQVSLVVLLAWAAAAIATWLSARPGLWGRWDATALGRNTLDPVLAQLIEKLPRETTAEIFFRPLEKPLDTVGFEAQERMRELLIVANNQLPHKLKVIDHNLANIETAAARMQELDVREPNVVVITDGENRVVLRLLRDIARVDPGNPRMKLPPRLEAFLGDQAFGNALLQLAIEDRPTVLFSTGHGERDLYGTDVRQLGRLHSALVADGFQVRLWEPGEDPSLPEDCDVLAVIDPKQPFAEAELESVRRFARNGGRLLIAPSLSNEALDGPGSMAELLRDWGILVQAGFVAAPVRDSFGNLAQGLRECATLLIGPEGLDSVHPVTESLWSVRRRVVLPLSRYFERGTAPENGVLLDLVRSSPTSWRDLPGANGLQDWRWDSRLEEGGSFILAMAGAFQAPEVEGPALVRELGAEERAATRIVALGSPDALGNGEGGVHPIDVNRDFALNAFNWLAARDHRLVIRPRVQVRRQLDLQNTNAQRTVNRVSTLFLPGACLMLGVLVWWRRRR